MPKGLYILLKGNCRVGCEKINIRSKKKLEYERFQDPERKPITLKGNHMDILTRDSQMNKNRINPQGAKSMVDKMNF